MNIFIETENSRIINNKEIFNKGENQYLSNFIVCLHCGARAHKLLKDKEKYVYRCSNYQKSYSTCISNTINPERLENEVKKVVLENLNEIKIGERIHKAYDKYLSKCVEEKWEYLKSTKKFTITLPSLLEDYYEYCENEMLRELLSRKRELISNLIESNSNEEKTKYEQEIITIDKEIIILKSGIPLQNERIGDKDYMNIIKTLLLSNDIIQIKSFYRSLRLVIEVNFREKNGCIKMLINKNKKAMVNKYFDFS